MKGSIRRLLLSRRNSVPILEQVSLSESIHRRLLLTEYWKSSKSVMLYVSIGSEVMTLRLVTYVLEDGKVLILPKVRGREILPVAVTSKFKLVSGFRGILEPEGGEVFDSVIDIAIVPVVGFDENGHRLGYGGGFYDRFLAKNLERIKLKVGLAYECQKVNLLPYEDRDVKLDLVITENGVYSF
ncbi:MAG: 5-formyltetrahydrofolate cyclo-ligase [Brevinematia bacterium]